MTLPGPRTPPEETTAPPGGAGGAVATVELGEHDEAEAYLKRAPNTDGVLMARAKSIVATNDRNAAAALLASSDAKRLSPELAKALSKLVAT